MSTFYRFPGPYVFGADTRFRSAELDRVTDWVGTHVPPGTAVVTDRFTGQSLTAYTGVNVPKPDQNPVYALYREGGTPSPVVRKALRDGNFRYWVLDRRVALQIPRQRFWPGYRGPASVNALALAGLDRSPVMKAVFRDGDYVVYELRLPPEPVVYATKAPAPTSSQGS